MLKTGIVSVTFRPLAPERVVKLTAEAGLDSVEWGSDVHVPQTDTANAKTVAALTTDAGLAVASYGSYFRAGYDGPEVMADVIRAAKVLGAPNIRVWAGKKGSAEEDNRQAVIDSLRESAALCAAENITLSLEFHQNTLTDHYASATRLMEEVGHDNLHLYWQPNQFCDTDYNLTALRAVLPYMTNVHVFTWEGKEKFPLAHGEKLWRQYLDIISAAKGDHSLLMEFVCDGSEDQFRRDAETLLTWLR